ncbi:hypothetical protein LIER_09725 [Lithospermum erythrorhizon]|uniref:Uncharacterized protein n=1 Tax=Lithospermum erythrorhizon TaxID=34254 RepID=A0AAV3PHX9_LITER
MCDGISLNEKTPQCFDSNSKCSSGQASEMDLTGLCECKMHESNSTTECEGVSTLAKTPKLFFRDFNGISKVASSTSCCSSIYLSETAQMNFDAQYQHWIQKLSQLKEEAMEATRKRWTNY